MATSPTTSALRRDRRTRSTRPRVRSGRTAAGRTGRAGGDSGRPRMRIGGQDERPAVVDQANADDPQGTGRFGRRRRLGALRPDIVVRDRPSDHRLGRGRVDRPVERGDHFQRSGRPDRDGPDRAPRLAAAVPWANAAVAPPRNRAIASPRRMPARRGGKNLSDARRFLLMTRFYRAGKRRRNRPRAATRGPRVVRDVTAAVRRALGPRQGRCGSGHECQGAIRHRRGVSPAAIAVADLPKAAMFDLRDQGYSSPFEQLVGGLISARTRDETTVKVCLRLFEAARTPQQMLALDEAELTRSLSRCIVRRGQGPGHPRDVAPDRRGVGRPGAR